MSEVAAEYKVQAGQVVNPAVIFFCPQCGCMTDQVGKDIGRYEIYTCLTCGYQQWFTVR